VAYKESKISTSGTWGKQIFIAHVGMFYFSMDIRKLFIKHGNIYSKKKITVISNAEWSTYKSVQLQPVHGLLLEVEKYLRSIMQITNQKFAVTCCSWIMCFSYDTIHFGIKIETAASTWLNISEKKYIYSCEITILQARVLVELVTKKNTKNKKKKMCWESFHNIITQTLEIIINTHYSNKHLLLAPL